MVAKNSSDPKILQEMNLLFAIGHAEFTKACPRSKSEGSFLFEKPELLGGVQASSSCAERAEGLAFRSHSVLFLMRGVRPVKKNPGGKNWRALQFDTV